MSYKLHNYLADYLREEMDRLEESNIEKKTTLANLHDVFFADLDDYLENALEAYEGGAAYE